MQGHWINSAPYYRCRLPAEYAPANKLDHPRNVYLREEREPHQPWNGRGCRFSFDLPGIGAADLRFAAC